MNPPAKRSRLDVNRRLKLHKRWRRVLLGVPVLLLMLMAPGWLAPSAFRDHGRYSGKRFTVTRVIDGDTFEIALPLARRARVTLLGVDAPDPPHEHFAADATSWLRQRLEGRAVLLRLELTQTRDARDRLLAYVYPADSRLLNAEMILDGRGYADRRANHPFGRLFDQHEGEARTKTRGLWENVRPDAMPPWRQKWLQSLKDR